MSLLKMYHLNNASLLESVAFADEPSTQELKEDDEEGEFVCQKSRSRRFSQKSTHSSGQESPAKVEPKSKLSKTCQRVLANLFVDKIPLDTTKAELMDLFAKFGTILNMSICKRNPSNADEKSYNFAFITFESVASVEAALKQDTNVGIFLTRRQNSNVKLCVYRRKVPHRENRFSSSRSSSVSTLSLDVGHNHESEWYDILVKFDWKSVVAKYVLRDVTMEDHLREYIFSLASFLEHTQESLEDLKARLIFLSENCPSNIDTIMPPNISGLVYNQNQDKKFNLKGMLRLAEKQFRIEADQVFYLSSMSKESAKRKLKECLLKGLFIYFFAKFSHGQTFYIKNSYYERSEPIRSSLLVVTGITEVSLALRVFFNFFKDIFVFDKKKSGEYFDQFSFFSEIKLTVDFYSTSSREKLRSELLHPSDEKEIIQESPNDSLFDDHQFEMEETDNVTHDLKGRIRKLERDSQFGYVVFCCNGLTNLAIFNKCDFYINGHQYSNILEQFVLDREVSLDVIDQPLDDVQFKALTVWIGEKPDQDHPARANVSELLMHHMSDVLDPIEDVTYEQMDRPQNSASVQSVVQHVLENDYRRNLIINPEIVEQVLCRLKVSSSNQRNKIKVTLERQSRLMLIKILAQMDESEF